MAVAVKTVDAKQYVINFYNSHLEEKSFKFLPLQFILVDFFSVY